MGTKALRWALRQKPNNQVAKLTLLVLAAHAEADGTCDSSLSISVIADEATLSRRAVINALERLRGGGFLLAERTVRADGGNDRCTYRLALDPSAPGAPAPSARRAPAPVHQKHENVHEVHHPSAPDAPGMTSGNADPGARGALGTVLTEPKGSAAARTRGPARATRIAQAGEGARTREERLDELNETAKKPKAFAIVKAWRDGHDQPYRRSVYDQMLSQVDGLLADGCDAEVIAAALRAWHTRGDVHSPGALGWLYDDALKKRNATSTPGRPLIDDFGHPLVNPSEISDEYLTADVLERMLGPDHWNPPPWPRERELFDHAHGVPAELVAEMRQWQSPHVENRLQERRADARRLMIRSWNSRAAGAAS